MLNMTRFIQKFYRTDGRKYEKKKPKTGGVNNSLRFTSYEE
jgi:hypothetical protein